MNKRYPGDNTQTVIDDNITAEVDNINHAVSYEQNKQTTSPINTPQIWRNTTNGKIRILGSTHR